VAWSSAFVPASLNNEIIADAGFMYPINISDNNMAGELERRNLDSEREMERISEVIRLRLEDKERHPWKRELQD